MFLWSYIVAVLLAGTVQAVFPGLSWMGEARPPALLAVLLYYALTRSASVTLWTALAAGVMQDALGLVPLGYSSLCFAVVGLLVNRFRDDLFPELPITHALLGGAGAAVFSLALFGLLRAGDLVALPVGQLGLKCAGAAVGGALFTPIICALMAKMDEGLGLIENNDHANEMMNAK